MNIDTFIDNWAHDILEAAGQYNYSLEEVQEIANEIGSYIDLLISGGWYDDE